MNCPTCASPVTKAGRYCATCGYDFGADFAARLTLYLALKSEVDRIGAVQSALASGLANLALKLRDYEKMLADDAARAAVTGTETAQPVSGKLAGRSWSASPEAWARSTLDRSLSS